jgi:carbonic anhydrase/acetyltransferase-like protein (isoleucine patch superfamily)
MTQKYKLTSETIIRWGKTLYRIEALLSFGTVSAGHKGGFVESEKNLSQKDKSWIWGDAKIWGDAEISGDAKISGNAEISGNAKISGEAEISGNAEIWGNAKISGDAKISGEAGISGDAKIWGDAEISGDAKISGNAGISGNAKISGDAEISGDAKISGDAEISGNAEIWGETKISGDAKIWGNAKISGDAKISGEAEISGNAEIWGDENSFKQDLIAEVLKLPDELEAIRDALAFGKINGSTYSTCGCSCLAGTIAKNRNIEKIESGCLIEENGNKFQVDSSSPRERWFMGISEGNTPENNYMAKRAHEWICEAIVMRDHIRATSIKEAA